MPIVYELDGLGRHIRELNGGKRSTDTWVIRGPTSAGFISISVVQKILETCTDEHCAILLDHIKVDLQALEKVAYKKHMVAWAEQSCGEVSPPVNDCKYEAAKDALAPALIECLMIIGSVFEAHRILWGITRSIDFDFN
ncbi:uncharacterized protein LOC135606694 isoform X2 [Musa acuminata AAA Group]|uniref:uncharacterized protein LOC135606694 isoform X2 n=1 Tax=Musa acuminata AAA Group TaxID=214697 RepID=UPI0031CE98FA